MSKNITNHLELELSVHLEEYKAKMAEISSVMDALHQTFTLTITAIGFVLATAPYIIQSNITIVFAAASLVFYSLTLTQLRHSWTIFAVENYVVQNLRPSIQEILSKLSPHRKKYIENTLLWSAYGSRTAYTSRWWQFPIEAARYLLPIGAGLSCCITYLVTPFSRNEIVEIGVVSINILVVLYIVVLALSMRSQFIKEKNHQKTAPKVAKKKST